MVTYLGHRSWRKWVKMNRIYDQNVRAALYSTCTLIYYSKCEYRVLYSNTQLIYQVIYATVVLQLKEVALTNEVLISLWVQIEKSLHDLTCVTYTKKRLPRVSICVIAARRCSLLSVRRIKCMPNLSLNEIGTLWNSPATHTGRCITKWIRHLSSHIGYQLLHMAYACCQLQQRKGTLLIHGTA